MRKPNSENDNVCFIIDNYAKKQMRKDKNLINENQIAFIRETLNRYLVYGERKGLIGVPHLEYMPDVRFFELRIGNVKRKAIVSTSKNLLTGKWVSTLWAVETIQNRSYLHRNLMEKFKQITKWTQEEAKNEEDRTVERFINAGWEIDVEQEANEKHEMLLVKDGEVYGSVVCKAFITATIIEQLYKIVQRVTEEKRQKLFVLTNGVQFDIFLYGVFKETVLSPPSPEEIDLLSRQFR